MVFMMSLSLQRSISFRNVSQMERAAHPPFSSSTMKTRVISATVSNPSSSSSVTATRVSTATAPAAKRRDSKLWSETFDVRLGATQPLSPKEIKRQEVREISAGLKFIKKNTHTPLFCNVFRKHKLISKTLSLCRLYLSWLRVSRTWWRI